MDQAFHPGQEVIWTKKSGVQVKVSIKGGPYPENAGPFWKDSNDRMPPSYPGIVRTVYLVVLPDGSTTPVEMGELHQSDG